MNDDVLNTSAVTSLWDAPASVILPDATEYYTLSATWNMTWGFPASSSLSVVFFSLQPLKGLCYGPFRKPLCMCACWGELMLLMMTDDKHEAQPPL